MVGRCCAVASCRNNYGKHGQSISFHRFPTNPTLQKQWISLCKMTSKFNIKTSFICSAHFKPEDFTRDMQAELLDYTPRRKLLPESVPTVNIPHDPNIPKTESGMKRQKKMEKKKAHAYFVEVPKSAKEISLPLTSIAKKDCLVDADEVSDPKSASEHSCEPGFLNFESLYEEIKKINATLQEKCRLQAILLKKASVQIKRLKIQCKRNDEKINNIRNKVKKMNKLMNKYKSLAIEKEQAAKESVEQTLGEHLSSNEMKLFTGKQTKVHWNSKDISKAFTLRYLSKQAYIYVSKTFGYLLPRISSLDKWAKAINLRDGLLSDVLKVMETAGKTLDKFGRLTVLMFNDMKVQSTLEYDTLNNEIFGRYKQMQVVMATDLCGKWKQPIFVGFDQKITKVILYSIIESLREIGYPVVACVSDMSPGNFGLMKELGLDHKKSSFSLPNSTDKIFYFSDSSQLLNLIRNWFLVTGFELEGNKINSEPIEELLKITAGELRVCHKVTNQHLIYENSQRQDVSVAAQLFSHTTATALLHYQPGMDKQTAINTGNFIASVSNWFDLMNSRAPGQYQTPFTASYGDKQFLDKQNEFLKEFYETISKLRCCGKKKLQPFQKGILMSLNSLKLLQENLADSFNCQYLLTAKLNQDPLENLFSQIRSKGSLNDYPSPLNALYRLQMILLGQNGVSINSKNTTVDNNEEFVLTSSFGRQEINISEGNFSVINDSETDTASKNGALISTSSPSRLDCNREASEDAVSYLAGWIAKKCINEFHFGDHSYKLNYDHEYSIPPWIQHLSYGGLIVPSEDFVNKIKTLEALFNKIWDDNLLKEKKLLHKLLKKSLDRIGDNFLPLKVMILFFKQRIIIKIRYLNDKWEQEMRKKRTSKSQLESISKFRKTCV